MKLKTPNLGPDTHGKGLTADHAVDLDSQQSFSAMGEAGKVRGNQAAGVRTVLVVLSSRAMVFDVESLRQKIHLAYPDAAVFFQTTAGSAIGSIAPSRLDLVIDFTGPGQWGWSPNYWFRSRRLKSRARIAVGRNAGIFRAKSYDRVFDELAAKGLPRDLIDRERHVQREVLKLAGVAFVQQGDATTDRAYSIALELPAMQET